MEELRDFLLKLEEARKSIVDIMLDKNITDALATFYWNLHQSLQEKGFSSQSALEIVKHINAPQGGKQ